jgi:hypothetical protein
MLRANRLWPGVVLIMLLLVAICFCYQQTVEEKPNLVTSQKAELLAEDIRYMSESHAVDRHGQIALSIKTACENNPSVKRKRQIDGRVLLGCEYKPGKWGASIYEQWPPVDESDYITSFPNKSKTLEQFIRYCKNRGYQ